MEHTLPKSPGAYGSLEIVFVHYPKGLQMTSALVPGVDVTWRSGTEKEFLEMPLSRRKAPTLYVATEAQYEQFLKQIENSTHHDKENWGLVLLQSPDSTLADSHLVVGKIKHATTPKKMLSDLSAAALHLVNSANSTLLSTMASTRDAEAKAINAVGLAIAGQHTIDELLRVILDKAVELCAADAGFLLLRENLFAESGAEDPAHKVPPRSLGTRYVQKGRVIKSQNIRLNADMLDPITNNFTALVSNRAHGLSWSEGAASPEFWRLEMSFHEHQFPEPGFEYESKSYGIKSYCAFPLRTPSHEVVGLLILVNRRQNNNVVLKSKQDIDHWVTAFTERDMTFLEALASQAGVSLDHTRLYRQLTNVFESFVQASVTAIESRDPSTKGHSERVALLTVAFAESVNQLHKGPYASIYFTPSQIYEIKYASLLHDFGKIGVREDVLRKGNKFHSYELSLIRDRFELIEQRLHLKCMENYLDSLMRQNRPPNAEEMNRIKKEMNGASLQLQKFWDAIVEANEPQVTRRNGTKSVIDEMGVNLQIGDQMVNLLTQEELNRLNIKRGSLSDEERAEIDTHVTHSYKFLIEIPWSQDLANIPDIVYTHHERLDGSGYPRKILAGEIPVQAKLMAITDIYDALVAKDRPYKKAVSHQVALDILEAEVREGKLDRDLFNLFVEANIGLLISPQQTSTRVA